MAPAILVYGANGKPLYRAWQHVRSGTQAIQLVVPRAPAGAIVDPDHELLDRQTENNEVKVGGGASQ